ncbi:5243_t:CDS:2, partial [Gigaspora margarita]
SFTCANKYNPEVITNDMWPGIVDVLKTNTALKYDQEFNVEAWGFLVLAQIPSRHSRQAEKNNTSKPVELFKLHLANMPEKDKPMLPKELDYKKAITDYLTEMEILILKLNVFLKIEKLIKETIVSRWPNVSYEQILVIMTVLAEFTKQASATIRECAYRAGLISSWYTEKLQLSTEHELYTLYPMLNECTEAAAIYCMRTLKEHIIKVGSSFMIVDCGSGTIDLTMRELLKNNRLGEITECS